METTIKYKDKLIGSRSKIDSAFNFIECTDGRKYVESVKTQLCYSTQTPSVVVSIIESLFHSRERIVFDFGDIKTGQSWGEVNDISGRIGRSTGVIKIPLLVHNRKSLGGGALSDNCIVRILESKGKKVIYSHQNYKAAK